MIIPNLRSFSAILPLLLLAMLPVVANGQESPGQSRPNIVLLMTDDQGWAETSYMGHPHLKTPNLDEMAANGLRFDRFYSSSPVCTPTRASVLTGRHPARFECMKVADPIKLQELTIAQVLQNAGYRTGFFGKWHINDYRDSGTGMVMPLSDPRHPTKLGFDESVAGRNYFDLNPTLGRNGEPEEFTGDTSDIIMEEALKFIRNTVAEEQQFLAVVWYPSPHSPFEALPEDQEPYAEFDKKLRNKWGELHAVDRSVGRLRRELRELGIAEETLLWFCSDNGGTLTDREGRPSVGPLRGSKNDLWEGGIRVPGIIEWPGHVTAGQVTDTPASTLDIYPTLLDLANLEIPENQPLPLDGLSLVPALDGNFPTRTKFLPFWHIRLRGKAESVALIEGRYKIILPPLDDGGTGEFQLFDVVADISEEHDLAQEKPDLLQTLRNQLEMWQDSARRSQAGEDYKP